MPNARRGMATPEMFTVAILEVGLIELNIDVSWSGQRLPVNAPSSIPAKATTRAEACFNRRANPHRAAAG